MEYFKNFLAQLYGHVISAPGLVIHPCVDKLFDVFLVVCSQNFEVILTFVLISDIIVVSTSNLNFNFCL
jgi:hypothetical protein